ncbi:MAG TPA: hypothetical protein VKP11_12390 [Frankiaceae bacterium]|nr:hypothetical protein [Frankiaceae bacterium]
MGEAAPAVPPASPPSELDEILRSAAEYRRRRGVLEPSEEEAIALRVQREVREERGRRRRP